jgi:hypothetical protein
MPWALLLLIAIIGLLVLIPTRRLFLAGWSPSALTAYFLVVAVLALFVAELRGPARYLIPILVIAYIAPFITARDGIARLRNRISGVPPAPRDGSGSGPAATGRRSSWRPRERAPEPKNVTPKDGPPDRRAG